MTPITIELNNPILIFALNCTLLTVIKILNQAIDKEYNSIDSQSFSKYQAIKTYTQIYIIIL